ncbi:hypothetical protein SFC79_14570 [Nocardioides sp. S-58]|uniref:Uncharacterized protein n=1 Tax=Nocardioides renjunii TaxID=3095075 RepID=A0ABU5KDF3_9ACTN|nr:hypothetical protein [Nocardioides sp. S-58]MDZ5662998.1 hypothetical protein [Nocardioides sp. S-58]
MTGPVDALLLAVLLGAGAAVVWYDRVRRAWRRVHDRVSPPPPTPDGPAIEDLARSLRRVRAEVLAPAPGTTMARRRGTRAAYEDLLLQAAVCLGVPDTLSEVPEGTDREAERLRLEHLLREAGLSLD